MATRNLTHDYVKIRCSFLSKPYSKNANLDEEDDLKYLNGGGGEDIELGDVHQFTKQPGWLLILKGVQENMSTIKNSLEVLKTLQAKHTSFNLRKDFKQEEIEVNMQTADIKRLFLECKAAVDKIDTSKDPKSQEELMKRNLKISLVNELNDLSSMFRDEQQEYLKNLERYKSNQRANKVQYEEDNVDLEPEERRRLDEMERQLQADPSFTDDQIRQLIQNEQHILRRDKELRTVLQSIVELNELFKEFSQLVVEQGTLLDRIDYNLENTFTFVEQATKDLKKAEEYQKMSRMTLFILLLVLLMVGIAVVLALKFILKFNGISFFSVK